VTITNRMRPYILDIRKRIRVCGIRCMPSIVSMLASAIMGLSILAFPYFSAFAQDTISTSIAGSDTANISKGSVRNYTGVSFEFSNQRDPFLNPLLKKKTEQVDREIDRGVPPPGIAGTFIEEAVLKGISIRENGRLAIVRGNGNRANFLREGDRLFDGYLKTIHRDSITLVREINMRSGKAITQEVTKQLRTQ